MSDYKAYKGKLIPTHQTLEEYCMEHGINPISHTDSLEETFYEIFEDSLILFEGMVYTVEKDELDPYESTFEGKFNSDGSISFVTKFYNGGCGLGEALEVCAKNAKESS